MKLTKEEQKMLDGKHGSAMQKAMELLNAVGECYDAQYMVPVASVHLSQVNPVTAGEGGVNFLKGMAEKGSKFVVPTTTNPGCFKPWDGKIPGFSEELYRVQFELSETFAKMGCFVCHTCTPYLIGHAPLARQHVAWGESSAVIYANAVLGARTNRECGPTGLAAALSGRIPAYGYHLEENRRGILKIVVNAELKGITDYATLGYFTGKIAQDRVPIFTGIPPSVSQAELKYLGGACATSGSVAHYHVVGVTPEATTEEVASGGKKISPSDTLEFGSTELKETEESLCKAGPEEADVVILGCPHASIDQLKNYAEALAGRKVKSKVDFWILVSHIVKRYAEDLGYARIIESTGARLCSNTCPTTIPRDFFRNHGYKVAATDSSKMAFYVAPIQDVRCYYGSLHKFIDIVTSKQLGREVIS